MQYINTFGFYILKNCLKISNCHDYSRKRKIAYIVLDSGMPLTQKG